MPDLGPSDFIVREDKVAREILKVAPAADPMQIVVLVDNSQAADQFIPDYREALPAFINTIAADETGARHEISIVTLAERPTLNTDYTTDVDRLIKGAQRIFCHFRQRQLPARRHHRDQQGDYQARLHRVR